MVTARSVIVSATLIGVGWRVIMKGRILPLLRTSRPALVIVLRIALALAALIGLILLARIGVARLEEAMSFSILPKSPLTIGLAIAAATLFYVICLSVPYVPGAEIGVFMLAMFGARIAPLIYVATVLSLLLAYGIGRLVPLDTVAEWLNRVRLTKAGGLVAQMAATPPADIPALLMPLDQPRFYAFFLRFRFLALMVLFNLPGNTLVGGGGGIAMVAGLSRLYAPLPYVLCVIVAVLPVPLAVFVMGK